MLVPTKAKKSVSKCEVPLKMNQSVHKKDCKYFRGWGKKEIQSLNAVCRVDGLRKCSGFCTTYTDAMFKYASVTLGKPGLQRHLPNSS